MDNQRSAWWEQHWFHALLILASALPLLYPTIPPLVDFPGHLGRYRVELDHGMTPSLAHFYTFQWHMIGNLGIDLLIIPVAKIFGLELGAKLIVITIPMLAVTGMLWIAREVHGKVTPTALFALPLAYAHPFIFGFINYSLSMALALCAFALWLRLERMRKYRLRAIVFLFISPLLWICHAYGWAALCLLTASSEIVHQHDKSGRWGVAIYRAALNGLALAPPIILMLIWRSGHVAGGTGPWFVWSSKFYWIIETLRDSSQSFDTISVYFLIFLILTVIAFVLVKNPWLTFSRNLAVSAVVLLIMFLLLPYVVFGSAYADMRLTPYVYIIALLGIRMQPHAGRRVRLGLAIAGLCFFVVRTGGTIMDFARADKIATRALGALNHVPQGARLISFVGRTCSTSWVTNRLEHIPAMAIVRRAAFSNDQWDMEGAQLLRSNYPAGTPLEKHFGRDPSHMTTPPGCRSRVWFPLNKSLAFFPRDKFDYVWLLDPPAYDVRNVRGMSKVWSDGSDALYHIDDHSPLGLLK